MAALDSNTSEMEVTRLTTTIVKVPDETRLVADDLRVVSKYDRLFARWTRLMEMSKDLFFGAKMIAVRQEILTLVDALLEESLKTKPSVTNQMVTYCLTSIAGSIGTARSARVIDSVVEDRIRKFFDKCLDLLFVENCNERLGYVNRITLCLTALLSEADTHRLGIDLIERIVQKLVKIVIANETKLNDAFNNSKNRLADMCEMGDIAFAVRSVTEIGLKWFEREPDVAFPLRRHKNWITSSCCKKRLIRLNVRINEIYSDIEFSTIHSQAFPIIHEQMIRLQMVLRVFRDKFRVYTVQHLAVNYDDRDHQLVK